MNNTRILLSGLCCSFLVKLIIERLRNLLVKLGDKLLQRIKLDFIFNNNLKNINSADLHFWDGSSSGKTFYSINPTRKIEVNLNELILRA